MQKILVIKNEKKKDSELESFFNNLGYRSEFVYDGGMGVQSALKFRPDIIISELNLSMFSGIEIYNIIKKIDFLQDVPFIILSQKNRKEEILEGIQLGMDGFIEKPIDYFNLGILLKNKLSKINLINKCYKRKCCFLNENPFAGTFFIKNYRFSDINKKFQEISGYDQRELLEKNIFDIIFDKDISKIIKGVNNCVKEININMNDELRFINKKNEIIHTHLHANVKETHPNLEIIGYILPFQNHKIIKMGSEGNHIQLSKREKEVLELICKGYINQEMAELLFISERTVEGHRARIMDKTNSKNTVQLVVYALKHNYFCIE